MKNLFFIFIILLFYSCGKPASRNIDTTNSYYSTRYIDQTTAISTCVECAIVKFTTQTVSITLSPNAGVTTCAGQMVYRAPNGVSNYFQFPTVINEEKNFVIEPVSTVISDTDGFAGGSCFPQAGQDTMILKKISSTEFSIYFNNINKGYVIKKF